MDDTQTKKNKRSFVEVTKTLQAQSHTLQGRTRNTHFDGTRTQTDVD